MKTLRNILVGGGVLLSNILINPVFSQEKIQSLYYGVDKHELSIENEFNTEVYLNQVLNYPELNTFDYLILKGYADSTYTPEHNLELSGKRTFGVRDYINFLHPELNERIVSSYHGEIPCREGEDLSKYRRVDIIPYKNDLDYALKLFQPDSCFKGFNNDKPTVVLCDVSGSMGQNGAWEFLCNYDFSKFHKFFAFSRFPGRYNDLIPFKDEKEIKRFVPGGRTCYYTACKDLIEELYNYNILTIINGEDNVGEGNSKDLIEISKKNNLNLSFITLDTNKDFLRELEKIAFFSNGLVYDLYGNVIK